MTAHQSTRRTILAGAAAVPITIVAGASPAQSMGAGDRELFDIEAEIRELDARVKTIAPRHTKAEEAVIRWDRRNPQPKMREVSEDHVLDDMQAAIALHLRTPSRSILKHMIDLENQRPESADLKAAKAEHFAALAQWSIRRQAALYKCGFDEIDAEWNRLLDQGASLAERAAQIQATTIDGIRCKARLAAFDCVDKDAIAASIVGDLNELRAA